MKNSIIVLFALPFFTMSSSASSQVIWSEDFESYSIGTGYIGSDSPVAAVASGDYPGAVTKWTLDTASAQLTATTDWLAVQLDDLGNNVFEIRDADGEFVWSSETITITGYLDVALCVSVSEVSNLESTDYLNVYYKLDGGIETVFETNGANSDNFTTSFASQENITGTSIQIIIRGKNNANSERIRFDNIVVAEKSLLITEITHPSDNSSASYIELKNCSNHLLDFDTYDYYISIQTDGSTWNEMQLQGSLCAGCVTVYAQSSSGFTTAYSFNPPEVNSIINGDGNDAYFIFYNGGYSTGYVVDVYGVLNENGTGEIWDYENSRTIRSTDIVAGSPFWSASGWTISPAAVIDMSPGALENELRYYNSIWYPKASAPTSSSDDLNIVIQEGTSVISAGVECSSLSIFSSASLVVNSGIGLTVSGNCVNSGVLKITSDAGSSGSIIVNGTSTNNINFDLYLTGGASNPWHLIAAPLQNQSISSFVTNSANSIQTSASNNYGLANFNTSTQSWNYFHNGAGSSPNINAASAGSFQDASGYSVLRSSTGLVTFSGLVNTSDQITHLTASKWNLVGNPYPSFVSVNTNSNPNDNLINSNAMVTNPVYQALYVWDVSALEYSIINQLSPATYLAPGQAAFVLADSDGGDYTFTETMCSHQSGDWFERLASDWVSAEMIVSTEQSTSKTELKFIENKTFGLDVGYDAGRFTGGSESFFVATKFVDNSFSQIDLALQCLPEIVEGDTYTIPLSVFSFEEIELTFQLNSSNIPSGIVFYLIDNLLNTSTNLCVNGAVYACLVDGETYNSNRFTLSLQVVEDVSTVEFNKEQIDVYTSANGSSLNIVGEVLEKLSLTIYDALGKTVIPLQVVKSKQVSLLNLPSGIYFVKVYYGENTLVKKIHL
jgi:hypothetical protein